MKFTTQLAGIIGSLLVLANPSQAKSYSSEYNVLEFKNLGFSGTYDMVKSFSDIYSSDCSCEVASTPVSFSGTNAPLNEELSVHFRGPLILNKFAYYVAESFTLGDSSSDDWSRLAYYDSSSATAENVTFLNRAGANSTCLGNALTYADSDGISSADSATVLAEDTLLHSAEEYVIMSNISCESSGYDNDCGVYREDIPAYHGYYGTTKMFLFEFQMPNETETKSVSGYNMPAIWLLNAHIPRTSQYPTNASCSCWESGCGEFDIYEVMNTTDSKKLFSTIHDYQGTGLIDSGLQDYGYIERDYDATMMGGVVFDSSGNAVVFISNSTSIDESISASDLNSWISDAGSAAVDTLASVAVASTSTTSKKSSGANLTPSFFGNVILGLFSLLYCII